MCGVWYVVCGWDATIIETGATDRSGYCEPDNWCYSLPHGAQKIRKEILLLTLQLQQGVGELWCSANSRIEEGALFQHIPQYVLRVVPSVITEK